jgi:Acetoacetate decarboxylase (ADC)
MPPADQPSFVPRGGEQVFCQPLELRQVRFTSFLFHADTAALQAVCDRYLNGPSGGTLHYRPLLPRVVLGVADIGRVYPIDSPDERKGWVSEIDVAFWMPVARYTKVLGVSFTEQVAWFLPYVFVDNAWAVAAGREVYGFPKEMASFQVPRAATDPAVITVDALALERFDPDAQARVQRLLELRRTDDPTLGEPHHTWDQVEEAFEDFLHVLLGNGGVSLPGFGLLVQAFQFIAQREVPLLFLRQFRDVADGRRACYQAVIEALTRVLHFRKAGKLPGEYRLTLQALDSHPIARELGLSAQGQDALGAWYVDFDFILENGRELWRA